jgi:hypothetical protein
MTDIQQKLADYKEWSIQQDWYQSEEHAMVLQSAPGVDEIQLIEDQFGKLPASYIQALNEFGISSFTYDCYVTRMLSPAEVIELYEVVQDEMDFSDDLRDMLLEEGVDLSKYIPVMAGAGMDGCWALLNIGEDSKGEIMYWDTDQPGFTDDIYDSLGAFIQQSIDRAKENNPLRLT